MPFASALFLLAILLAKTRTNNDYFMPDLKWFVHNWSSVQSQKRLKTQDKMKKPRVISTLGFGAREET